ncbi:MAG: clostripain-related cysteine peptidase [Chloroflexota bacterium]|nr:clostripain-related cysteine peptidase [Chloroflexota bacterium]
MINRVLSLAVTGLRRLLFTKRLHSGIVFAACILGLSPAFALAAPHQEPSGRGHTQQAPSNRTAEWLVMIYSNADDNVLEEDLLIDLQEAELAGSSDEVTIVAQIDRYEGGYAGMGDWSGAKRFLITQDGDMSSLGSEELEDLGEVNMADGATLLDFLIWAVSEFPAQKRMLILSDHGSGWPGGWGDPDPGGPGAHDIVLVDAFGDNLWLMELDEVLEQARRELGLDYFDVIGFDACLMGQLEVFTAIAPHALYAVASQELEPGLGWAYAAFLGQLVSNPDMDGGELSQHVVASYIDEDMRLEDPAFVGNLSRAQAAAAIAPDITLSAVDLAGIAPLNAALDAFVAALYAMDQNAVAQARTYAQSYESVFGDELPSPYIDLGHFSQLIQNLTQDPAALAAAQELDAARQAAVIAERHGPERPGSTGIAIYFPVREMYGWSDNLGYAEVSARFAQETQWDEFLAFHAGDAPVGISMSAAARPHPEGSPALAAALQTLLPELAPEYVQILHDEIAAMMEQALLPEEIAQVLMEEYELPLDVVTALLDAGLLHTADAAPALAPQGSSVVRKPLQAAPIRLSFEAVFPGEPVSIETDITGERVGYVYSFIGRFLPEEDVLIVEDQDFLFADQDTAVGGVTYPLWPKGAFTVGYDWEPVVYAISDGVTSIRTLLSPETYGERPVYTADGIYAFADGSPDRYARLFFRDGELAQVFGFAGAGGLAAGAGAPRQIKPQRGDQFTVFDQGYNLAEDVEDARYLAPSGVLTFGEDSFFIEETPAPSGNYVVGVIAEDLDGVQVEAYESLFVVGYDEVTEEGFVPLVADDLGFALLHPETWAPVQFQDETANSVTLANAGETALMTVFLLEYPDAANDVEANLMALEDVFAELANDAALENLAADRDPVDYLLGSYDALLLDFSFDSDGVAYAGELVAATPMPGLTYVVFFAALAEEADYLLADLDAVLYSFDSLYSGIGNTGSPLDAAAPQPQFADVTFMDDYSDPASGLYDDEAPQEWGQGYYDPDGELYVYAMNPWDPSGSGAIFDYYYDLVLPDAFMLQVSTLSAGAIDTAYGLIFQVQDDSHFYAFRVSGDGYFLVEKADGEVLETVVDWTPTDALDLTQEALNTLAVVGAEGVYRLYVNGVQVGEFADDSYSAGSAGYMVKNFDAAEPAAFVFDDFVVGAPAG